MSGVSARVRWLLTTATLEPPRTSARGTPGTLLRGSRDARGEAKVSTPLPPSFYYVRGSLLVALLIVCWAVAPDFAILWAVTFLNFLCGENFPFSRVSMYCRWPDSEYYVYVTDEHDRPIATRSFRLSASTLKKLYHANVGGRTEQFMRTTAEDLAPAGRRVLLLLVARAKRHGRPLSCRYLRLYQVNLHYRQNAVQRQKSLISEVPVC